MLLKLRQAWHGTTYELLTRNCLHFCDAFAAQLQVPAIPAYLNRMAYGADAVATFANSAYEQVGPDPCASSNTSQRHPTQSHVKAISCRPASCLAALATMRELC